MIILITIACIWSGITTRFNNAILVSISKMFSGCQRLTSLDLRNFETEKTEVFGFNEQFEGVKEISQQIDLMLSLLSGKTINKVGILSCSNEANSAFQVREAKKALECACAGCTCCH